MTRLLVFIILFFSLSVEARTIRLAVIDSGVGTFSPHLKICPNGLYDLTKRPRRINVQPSEMTDEIHHGTNVSYIIADRLTDIDYCMYIIKIYSNKNKGSEPYILAFLIANSLHVDVVNYSSSGDNPSDSERVLLDAMKRHGITVVVAAGNVNHNLDLTCDAYPCCYGNTVCVGNVEDNGERQETSNYGSKLVWERGCHINAGGWTMTGTSQATALRTARIVREMAGKR